MQIKSVLNGKEINLTSDNTVIKSTNFKVDKDGNMTCNNAKISGGEISITSSTALPKMIIGGDENNVSYKNYVYSGGMKIYNGNNLLLDLFPVKDGSNIYGVLVLKSINNGSSTTISYDSIYTPELNATTILANNIKQKSAGYCMCGLDTSHKYNCNWTGSQLQFFVDGQNVGTLSDKRLKTEIQDIDEDFIKIINEVEMKQFKIANRNGLISFGILAQDLIGIFEKYNKNPFDYEIVQETQYKIDDETIYYTINYEQFLILKQKATDIKLQKQQEQIDMLVNEIQELRIERS